MKVSSLKFQRNAAKSLNNNILQGALKNIEPRFVGARREAISHLDDFEAVRSRATTIRDQVLANLDQWLIRFEQEAQRRGAIVHWAETAEEANRIICDIARQHKVKKAVKSKSMVSEECASKRRFRIRWRAGG